VEMDPVIELKKEVIKGYEEIERK